MPYASVQVPGGEKIRTPESSLRAPDRPIIPYIVGDGPAPKYADKDMVNPGSVILSGEMMLRYMGWGEAADRIVQGMSGAIRARMVTYDFHRLMEGATKLSASAFGGAVIAHMT